MKVSSVCMFGLSRHPVSRYCQHANPAPVNSHRTWSIPVSTQSDFAVVPHENVCQPSFVQSKSRLIRARLSHLQTVIDGQESRRALDKLSKLHRSRLETSLRTRRSGSLQLAFEETLSKTACPGTDLHCKPTRSVDPLCDMCPSPTLRSQAHCSVDVRLDTVIGVQEALKRMSLLRDNDFTAKAVRHMIAEVEGRKRRKKKAPPQSTIVNNTVYKFWTGIQCDDATITSVLPDNSSPLCREHPSDGKDESTTRNCSDDGRALVNNLSGGLARKLQRSASLVNAGLSKKKKKKQTVLDAAVVDRCDSVEISSFSLLRSDGVGNHDAQTRKKLLGWFSEKRTQKAWFSPPVIAHQNNSTRCKSSS